jgi:NAD(P)-dependent dehydrogenase (short-subunit alcohol dehydrogenase family)
MASDPYRRWAHRTIVVTGAASGIGRRAAVHLTRSGCHAVVVGRSRERLRGVVSDAMAAARHGGVVTAVAADLADLSQVRRAAARITELGPVAALINNAAVFDLSRSQPKLTVDGIEETFAVNHVAPFVLTTHLLPALDVGAVVVTAASKGLLALPWLRLDPDDIDSRASYRPTRAYYRSKIAQLAFTAELGRRGVGAVALRVPSVRVDDDKLAGYPAHLRAPYRLKALFAADPADIAAQYARLATGPPRAAPPAGHTTARHVDERGRDVPWVNGTDAPAFGVWVWDRTAALAGARPGR